MLKIIRSILKAAFRHSAILPGRGWMPGFEENYRGIKSCLREIELSRFFDLYLLSKFLVDQNLPPLIWKGVIGTFFRTPKSGWVCKKAFTRLSSFQVLIIKFCPSS
jgi:hypothetical protein